MDTERTELLNGKVFVEHDGRIGLTRPGLFKPPLIQFITRLECAGSCPDLTMSRTENAKARPVPVALTPQLPPRVHRPLCVSVSSDSSGRFKALETQEWKNNLKAQVKFFMDDLRSFLMSQHGSYEDNGSLSPSVN